MTNEKRVSAGNTAGGQFAEHARTDGAPLLGPNDDRSALFTVGERVLWRESGEGIAQAGVITQAEGASDSHPNAGEFVVRFDTPDTSNGSTSVIAWHEEITSTGSFTDVAEAADSKDELILAAVGIRDAAQRNLNRQLAAGIADDVHSVYPTATDVVFTVDWATGHANPYAIESDGELVAARGPSANSDLFQSIFDRSELFESVNLRTSALTRRDHATHTLNIKEQKS